MKRGIVVAGCALLFGAALAGCSGAGAASGSAGGTGGSPVPEAAAPASQPGPAAETGAGQSRSGQPSTGSTPVVTPCRTGDLRVAQLPGDDGAAGTIVVLIQVRNVSDRACTLRGYPTFTLASHSASPGTAVTEHVTPVHGGLAGPFATPVTTVRLAPPGSAGTSSKAGFFLAYRNGNAGVGGDCDMAVEMRLTLPGQSGSIVGPVGIPVCSDTVQVSAFVPASQLAF